VIDDLPGVSESAVIGVPHPDLGEGVVAVVVGEGDSPPGEADLIAACKQQLAGFKVPKRAVFVGQLPRNTMSKVQKNQLRKEYSALFDAAAHQDRSH
jgi:malonyl-CoA/methylmalonyl-CoA synthetase